MKNLMQKNSQVFFGGQYNKNIFFILLNLVFPGLIVAFISLSLSPEVFARSSARQNFGIFLTIAKPAAVITNSDVNHKKFETSQGEKIDNNSLILISRDGLMPTYFTSKNISVQKIEHYDQEIVHKAKISTRVFDNRIELPSKKYFLFHLQVKPSSLGEEAEPNSSNNMITFLYE